MRRQIQHRLLISRAIEDKEIRKAALDFYAQMASFLRPLAHFNFPGGGRPINLVASQECASSPRRRKEMMRGTSETVGRGGKAPSSPCPERGSPSPSVSRRLSHIHLKYLGCAHARRNGGEEVGKVREGKPVAHFTTVGRRFGAR